MGKATIVSGGTAGLYTIRPLHNRERLDAEIARIEASIDDLEAARIDLQVALSDAEDAVAQARAAMDAAIAVMIETGDNSGLATAVKNLSLAAAHRNQAEASLALNTAQLVTERLELTRLQAVPADTNQSAWCADHTEDLSGEVATAEIPGEGTARIIVRPGYSGRSTYSALRDGQLFHRAGMSPAQAYFNAAILPGWQKWTPTYRVGTLAGVNKGADTGDVTLDAEQSSAQDLGINQAATITGAPIEYMECNANPFEIGDRVLVEFTGRDWATPKIIGFEADPRPCGFPDHVWIQVLFDQMDGDLVFVLSSVNIILSIWYTHGCCGHQDTSSSSARQRRSISYGGDGEIKFIMADGSFNESGDFSVDIDTSSPVEIDYLWQNQEPPGSFAYADLYDEKGAIQATPSYKDVDGVVQNMDPEVANVTWQITQYTGHNEISLPPRNNCDGELYTGWVSSHEVSGDIDLDSECADLVPDSITSTQRYLFAGSPETSLYSNITEFAIAKGAITTTITVSRGSTQEEYTADGFVGGALAYMKFTRSDLLTP